MDTLEKVLIESSIELRMLREALLSFKNSFDNWMAAFVVAVRTDIFDRAIYFVCTAASAVRLPTRIERALEAPVNGVKAKKALKTRKAEKDNDDLVSGTNSLAVSKGEGNLAKPSIKFSYVVLDEAGAMLEPDVIGTIIHGCRFLLCVGDHLQVPSH